MDNNLIKKKECVFPDRGLGWNQIKAMRKERIGCHKIYRQLRTHYRWLKDL